MHLSKKNQEIQLVIAEVFQQLGINVCVRIDGFLTPEGTILLHDPNTIPGMSPTSFIFKQMAEIGLNVTQALTYFIRQSIRERIRTGKNTWGLRLQLQQLDESIAQANRKARPAKGILFEASDEAYAVARLNYGKIFANGEYKPVPVLRTGDNKYYQLPNAFMFKEYIADVLQLLPQKRHPLLTETSERARPITGFFAGTVNYDVHEFADQSSIPGIDSWIVVNEEK